MWMVVGLLLLVLGGNLLVRHASNLAEIAGIPAVIIGLTVVAFGTGSPELFTSAYGRIAGEGGMALGNVVGSVIFNVFFTLGVSAIFAPMTVHSKLLSQEVPVVLVLSVVTVLFSLSGTIAKWQAGVLLLTFFVYTGWMAYQSYFDTIPAAGVDGDPETVPAPGTHWAVSLFLVLVGLVCLVAGGRFFVTSAARLAASLGVSRELIGLTVVGVGTSLPELITSLVASLRGESDIAVGNVVGSNLFNLTVVLGCTGLLGTGGLPVPAQLMEFDMLVMIAGGVVCLPVMFSGRRLDRWEGVVFVLYYAGYIGYLVLQAAGVLSTPYAREALLLFVIPLSLFTMFVIGYRAGYERWKG
jgi:cation:H+ antiporter